MKELLLDRNIRSWVFLSIVVVTFLVGIIRHYVSILLSSDRKIEPQQLQDNQAMIRSRLLREGNRLISPNSFQMRKNYFNNAETGYLKQVRESTQQNPMADPTMMTDMLKGNITNVLPMIVIGGWINWMFSGFITTKVPFPLTLRFKPMLQRGIELNSLDASWVSSVSWYFLNVFGLRSIYTLVLGENNQAADQMYNMQDPMNTAASSMPQDPKVAFKNEWEALEIVNHNTMNKKPNKIQKLDTRVVNRIAAGEVIQRPANAVKELLENCIDAKATNIAITVKSGGFKYLQIQDNGSGIQKCDLDIVCERFTTSKITEFGDLANLESHGFRGEALASISHIAHLSIQTKTVDAQCAYKASYSDGKLIGSITPCAGNQGTTITVEDLFFNVASRREALKNLSEEYTKIYEVVSRYAIHNDGISFSLKKYGENTDLRTDGSAKRVEKIGVVFGSVVSRDLIEINLKDDTGLCFEATGFASNINYSSKKLQMVLFINNRLVESTAIKKTLNVLYANYLPKGTFPFLYLDLKINPKNCDVNVHPTKHEVHFLHEDAIIDRIRNVIEEKLTENRSFKVQYIQTRLLDSNVEDVENRKHNDSRTTYDKDLVRTDSKEQKLEKFFGESRDKSIVEIDETSIPKRKNKNITPHQKVPRHEVKLLSVLQLREEIESACDPTLREIFFNVKFVGNVSKEKTLLQHNTDLYVCDNLKIGKELFYQFIVYNFRNFDQYTFAEPLNISNLVKLLFDFPDQPELDFIKEIKSKYENKLSKDQIIEKTASKITKLLTSKAQMLKLYFEFEIDSLGNLVGLPILLEGYMPDLTNLPVLLARLAFFVNWEEEKECFRTFSSEMANFYARISDDELLNECSWHWKLEHCFFPAVKRYFLPSKLFKSNGSLMLLTKLPELYKVFERC